MLAFFFCFFFFLSRSRALEVRRTGKAIVGVRYEEGVVLGGEDFVEGPLESGDDDEAAVFEPLGGKAWACGYGLAADTKEVCRQVRLDVEASRLAEERCCGASTERKPVAAMARRRNAPETTFLVFDGESLVRLEGKVIIADAPFAVAGEDADATALFGAFGDHGRGAAIDAVILALKAAIENDASASSDPRIHLLVLSRDKDEAVQLFRRLPHQ